MITGGMSFPIKLKTTKPFEWHFEKLVKKGMLKSRNLSEKKTTPSTNIPSLSIRKSEY